MSEMSGNLKTIWDNSEPFIGKTMVELSSGNRYVYRGIFIDNYDYYYVLDDLNNKISHYYSCVGDFESYGLVVEDELELPDTKEKLLRDIDWYSHQVERIDPETNISDEVRELLMRVQTYLVSKDD